MHGMGTFSWPDGKCYEGEYFEDKKEGYGVYIWPGDKRYEGNWKDGLRHGEGTLINKGKSSKHFWVNGKIRK